MQHIVHIKDLNNSEYTNLIVSSSKENKRIESVLKIGNFGEYENFFRVTQGKTIKIETQSLFNAIGEYNSIT
jgi:hypothetical protein